MSESTSSRLRKREKLLKGGAVPRKLVSIVVDDEEIQVECRGLTSGERGRLITSCTVPAEDEDGDATVDLEKMTPEIVIGGTFDPETGEAIFDEADRDSINAMSASFVDQLYTVITELSGLGKGGAKGAEKNSGATTV